jgi:hypothetical protein
MAESDMNKSSWQKPVSLHTAAATKSIGAYIGGELMRPGTLVAERGWKRSFDNPVPLPRGRYLITP